MAKCSLEQFHFSNACLRGRTLGGQLHAWICVLTIAPSKFIASDQVLPLKTELGTSSGTRMGDRQNQNRPGWGAGSPPIPSYQSPKRLSVALPTLGSYPQKTHQNQTTQTHANTCVKTGTLKMVVHLASL